MVGFPRAKSERTILGLEAKGKGVSVLVWALVCGVFIGIVGDVVKGSWKGSRVDQEKDRLAQAYRADGGARSSDASKVG